MDNQYKKTGGSDWLDEILGTRNTPKALGPDEIAVAAAGLTRPDDAELEKIIQETMAENWGEEPVREPAPEPEAPAASKPAKKLPLFQKKTPVQKEAPMKKNEAPKQKPQPPETGKQTGFKGFVNWFYKSKRNEDNLWGITHVAASLIWLVVIAGIGVAIGRMGWLCAADLLALGKTPKSVSIVVEQSDDITTISKKLQGAGLIKYPALFELFADLTGKGDNILVGTIDFNDEIVYDYNALCNAMTYKKVVKKTVEVLVPEGYSCAQIFKLLEQKGVCTAKELEEYAANGELEDYWFLEDVKRGHKYCLEGFLFPDTYEFYIGDKPGRVIKKFLDDFDYRFTDRLKDKFEALNKKAKLNLSIREVITMASMVEKEKANHLEGYTIASVFYNRLTHAASYPFLNSDATLLYDVEYYTGRAMTSDERSKSPYNTYTRKGLPVGPIANPGMGSIDAALAPEDTKYYYFVYDKKSGQSLFSKTLAEHQQKAKKLGLA